MKHRKGLINKITAGTETLEDLPREMNNACRGSYVGRRFPRKKYISSSAGGEK